MPEQYLVLMSAGVGRVVGGRHQMRKMSGKPLEVRLVLPGHSEGQHEELSGQHSFHISSKSLSTISVS